MTGSLFYREGSAVVVSLTAPNDTTSLKPSSFTTIGHLVCRWHEFSCGDHCLPARRRCDGVVDCGDARDERDCSANAAPSRSDKSKLYCTAGRRWCPGMCIPAHKWCDGKTDCSYGYDELFCPSSRSPPIIGDRQTPSSGR